LPEIGLETALDAKMPELKLNVLGFFREISPDIVHSYVQSGDTMAFALRFDHHKVPAFSDRLRVDRQKEREN